MNENGTTEGTEAGEEDAERRKPSSGAAAPEKIPLCVLILNSVFSLWLVLFMGTRAITTVL